ncbi:MAG: mono/diheme cytochrome c family protein [Verrucomicrobiales bacterium]|jgi:mono/diheme cytochrome c family protein
MRKCLLAILLVATVFVAPSSAKVDYATQIQPILDAKCAKCHQPARVIDGRKYKPKAGVILTTSEGIAETNASPSGSMVIDWGRPDHSLLVQRIMLDSAHEDVMPPSKENKPVTKQEIDLIKTWIKETGGSRVEVDPSKPVEKVSFSKIKAILASKCNECHEDPATSGKKAKGGLVLDTIAGIRTSGSVVSGKPGISELLIRMELPQNDDDVMPPTKKGKKMTEAELATFRNWILGGAPFGDVGGPPLKVKVMSASEVLSQGVKQPSAGALEKLHEFGAAITPISADSPMVTVEFISGAANAGDDFVKQLFLIAPNIAELDLSRTSITDGALDHIGSFARLTKLNLANTKVGDAGVAKLVNLKNLDWLNLYGTQVSDSGLPAIAKIRSLKTIYFSKSKTTPDGLGKLKKAFPRAKIVPDPERKKTGRFDVE